MIVKKFDVFLEKFREPKKPISTYFTKRINISKIELENICTKMNIPFEGIKYLSSGQYGNAYKVGDKVLKITSDRLEAKTVFNMIKSGQYDGVVEYYKIVKYNDLYLILMEYVYPLDKYIKKISDESILNYLYAIIDIIYDNWANISSKEILEKTIEDVYDVPKSGFKRYIIGKLWDLISKLKTNFKDKKELDIHPHNMGFNKNMELLIFDIRDYSNWQKNNDIETIK